MNIFSSRAAEICRIVLLIINGVFFVAGLIVIGVATYLYVDKSDLLAVAFQLPIIHAACAILIAVGCFVVFIPLLGLIAAFTRNKTLLLVYMVILLCITLLPIITVIMAIYFKSIWYIDSIRQTVRMFIQNRYGLNPHNDTFDHLTDLWDQTQAKWYCCGVEDHSWGVYKMSQWYEFQPGSKEYIRSLVPPSCCLKNQYGEYANLPKCQHWLNGPPTLQSGAFNEGLFYQGCYDVGVRLLQTIAGGLIGLGICIAAILCIGLGAAFVLWCALRRSNKLSVKDIHQAFGRQQPQRTASQRGHDPLLDSHDETL